MKRTRREVVAIAAALTMGPIAAHATAPGPTVRELIAIMPDARAAAAIGRGWLAGPDAPPVTMEALRRDIARSLRLDAPGPRPSPPAAARRRLRWRIRGDFAEARVVTVDGWMLSRVEAQLCALAWLHLAAGAGAVRGDG
jgi:hypothetical protein